jgi:hypothetical protein
VLFSGGGKLVTVNQTVTFEKTQDTLDQLRLQGAVVARTGKITLGETKSVTLDYDPAYLEALTKGMPNNRRRIAQVWTRVY